MKDSTARTVSTLGIWAAVAVSLAAGVFRRDWTGDTGLLTLMLVVFVIAGCGAAATAAVWRQPSDEAESRDAAEQTANHS